MRPVSKDSTNFGNFGNVGNVGNGLVFPHEVRLQESAGVRCLASRDLFRRPRHHHFAAGVASFGAEIDHVVGGLDDVHVVFDEQHRVPRVHQPVERGQQALDVGKVKSGGRLVQDVDRVTRTLQRAELGRDLDSLRFAARERGR